MQNDGTAGCLDHATIDGEVVVHGSRAQGELPAGHDNHTAAGGLDLFELLKIGITYRGKRRRTGWKLIGCDTDDHLPTARSRFPHGASAQFEGSRSVQTHATLGGVHALCNTEPQGPQPVAHRHGGIPVNGRGYRGGGA